MSRKPATPETYHAAMLKSVRSRRRGGADAFNGYLLRQIAGSSYATTPDQLAAIDEMLDGTYPGIDAKEYGPYALRAAADAGNLDVVKHLYGRFGRVTKKWGADVIQKLPPETREYLTAVNTGATP